MTEKSRQDVLINGIYEAAKAILGGIFGGASVITLNQDAGIVPKFWMILLIVILAAISFIAIALTKHESLN